MWALSFTQETTATPEQIWAYYEAIDLAPTWDPLVRRIEVSGPLAVGTTGFNTAKTGQRFPMIYTEMTRYRSYTEVTSVPLSQQAFTHVIEPLADGCRFTHGVMVTGPLAWAYRILLYRSYTRGIPAALRALAHLAETQPLVPPASIG